jgi:histone H3/H4
LWTSIRGAVTGVAAAYLAPVTGGASLALYAQAQQAKAAQAAAQQQQTLMPMDWPGPSSMPGAGDSGMTQTAGTLPSLVRGAAAAGRWLISARGIASTASGRLLGVMRGTTLFRTRQISRLAKEVGIQSAATALGITAVEVAQLIASDIVQRTRHRRGRGISARDIRSARRTITKMNNFAKLIHCAPRAPARRRSAGVGAIIRQG